MRQDKEQKIKCPACRVEAPEITQEAAPEHIIIIPEIIELNRLMIQRGTNNNSNKIYIGMTRDIEGMETEDKKIIDLQNTNKYYNFNELHTDYTNSITGVKTVLTRYYGLAIAHIRIFKHKTASRV